MNINSAYQVDTWNISNDFLKMKARNIYDHAFIIPNVKNIKSIPAKISIVNIFSVVNTGYFSNIFAILSTKMKTSDIQL